MNDSRVVSSTSSPATVVSCPTFTTRPVTATCTPIAGTAVSPTTAAVPTTDLTGLLGQLGISGITPTTTGLGTSPANIFSNPATQLGAFNPFLALAASNPAAALAKLSPALNIFNPAVNPNAGLLAFNPGAAPALALSAKAGTATLPFGKLGKIPGKTGI